MIFLSFLFRSYCMKKVVDFFVCNFDSYFILYPPISYYMKKKNSCSLYVALYDFWNKLSLICYVRSISSQNPSIKVSKRLQQKIYPQLFEHAMIVGLQQTDRGSYEPYVLYKFPEIVSFSKVTMVTYCFTNDSQSAIIMFWWFGILDYDELIWKKLSLNYCWLDSCIVQQS